MFSAIAEFERDLIRERTLAGPDNARKKARRGGRPKAMDRAAIVQAEALFQQGDYSFKAIAERMGVSVATFYRYVSAGIQKKEI
ncbi:helix-turn-helix domain-containing protein [Brucella sp. 22210]|uniref:helix-turn-helix domain-containing protein n=1 Tax=Brucella sp. 22210 TaxID=3453892 RepID=UPI003F858465